MRATGEDVEGLETGRGADGHRERLRLSSDMGPAPGITGRIGIDETSQEVLVGLRRQEAASFGPGRALVAGVVETRAGADVSTPTTLDGRHAGDSEAQLEV